MPSTQIVQFDRKTEEFLTPKSSRELISPCDKFSMKNLGTISLAFTDMSSNSFLKEYIETSEKSRVISKSVSENYIKLESKLFVNVRTN